MRLLSSSSRLPALTIIVAALAIAVAALVILHAYAHFPDEAFAPPAADEIAKLSPELRPLILGLSSADPAQRAEAALEFNALPPARIAPAIPHLYRLLPDRIRVRIERSGSGDDRGAADSGGVGYFTCPGALAARILATSGEEGLSALLRALASRNDDVRRSAIDGSAYSADPRLIPPLVAALADRSGLVRESALAALTRIGPRAIDALAAAMLDPDERIRAGAAAVLSQVNHPRSLAVLMRCLHDQRDEVRAAAAVGLDRVRDPNCLPSLIPALGDSAIREHAADVLLRLDHPQKTALLIDALGDPDYHVRAGAAYGLMLIRDPAAAAALDRAQRDPRPEVQRQAAEALAALHHAGSAGPR